MAAAAPRSRAWPISSSVVVRVAPELPTAIGRRPAAESKIVRRAADRSAGVRAPGSAITPITVRPSTPQAIARSTSRARLARSSPPSSSNGVGRMYQVPRIRIRCLAPSVAGTSGVLRA